MDIKTRILMSATRSRDEGFLRREFDRFGSKSAVTKALRELVREKRLVRLGYGAYMVGRQAGPIGPREAKAVMDVLGKLGTEPTWGGVAERARLAKRSTQVPALPTVTVRKRVTRKLGYGNKVFEYETEKTG